MPFGQDYNGREQHERNHRNRHRDVAGLDILQRARIEAA
jgi:hypothetical protein